MGLARKSSGNSTEHKHSITRALALTVFVFSLLVWVYVVVIQVTHPDWVTEQFSHIQIFPLNWRLDDVGMAAFAIAAIGFLVWQVESHSSST